MGAIELFCCLAALAVSTSGVKIHCNFLIRDWTSVGFLYTCTTTAINDENPERVTEISGTHLDGKGDEDVKGLIVEGDIILSSIPKDIEKFFANLEGLQWTTGNISAIHSSTFKPFPNLTFINLGYNKLKTLDGDLFQHTRKLQLIYFQNNLLEHVGHNLLSGLDDLTAAVFISNPCINALARTLQDIQDLNLQLSIYCTPLVTTHSPDPPTATPDLPTTTISTTSELSECSIRCTMNKEADEMGKRIEEIERRLRKLE